MIILGTVIVLLITAFVGFAIVSSAFSQRHWKRVIAEGDRPTLVAAVEEAFETFRGMRAPRGVPPADWLGLQSVTVVAADRDRCRVAVVVEPDIRVVDGERREVGPVRTVARRVAVRMAERLLYEIPLARFEAVQVDVYTEYRSPAGTIQSDCLLTTRVSRELGSETEWDEQEAGAILATWRTREAAPGAPVDPRAGAIIAPDELADAPGRDGAGDADDDAEDTDNVKDGPRD